MTIIFMFGFLGYEQLKVKIPAIIHTPSAASEVTHKNPPCKANNKHIICLKSFKCPIINVLKWVWILVG